MAVAAVCGQGTTTLWQPPQCVWSGYYHTMAVAAVCGQGTTTLWQSPQCVVRVLPHYGSRRSVCGQYHTMAVAAVCGQGTTTICEGSPPLPLGLTVIPYYRINTWNYKPANNYCQTVGSRPELNRLSFEHLAGPQPVTGQVRRVIERAGTKNG
jgi:hypothetical protein